MTFGSSSFYPQSRRRLPGLFALLLGLLLLPLVACGGDEEPGTVMQAEQDAGADIEGSPIGPVRAAADNSSGAGMGGAVTAPGSADAAGSMSMRWQWPEAWNPETPSSQMRMAQAAIPGEAGEATVAVFHFGVGGGGGVQANIDRWIGQMEAEGEPQREQFAAGGDYQVTWVEVAGTLKPSMMGTGPTEPQPNSRLIGAVVEGPGGPWFFKATGPATTLDAARGDFRAMLEAIEPR